MEDQYKGYAKVAKTLSNFSFVINRGSEHGVNVNDKYLVFGLGGSISDPDTGDDLGVLEVVKGRASVTHVQKSISTLTSIEKRTVPGTKRTIRREPFKSAWNLVQGPQKEVVEEGQTVEDAVIDAEVGDLVRPI